MGTHVEDEYTYLEEPGFKEGMEYDAFIAEANVYAKIVEK